MACRFYLFDDNLRCMSKAELVTTVETEFGITEKQKRFVEEMVYNDGSKTNEECAVSAGYAEGSAYVRASELTDPKRFPKVVRYKQHLEAQLSNKYQVTFGRHVRKLADIRDAALEKGNYTAAVAAEVQRGRAAGLYIERKEIRPGSLDTLSTSEIKERIKKLVADYRPLVQESSGNLITVEKEK